MKTGNSKRAHNEELDYQSTPLWHER